MDIKEKYAHLQDKLDEISKDVPINMRLEEANKRIESILPRLWEQARLNLKMLKRKGK